MLAILIKYLQYFMQKVIILAVCLLVASSIKIQAYVKAGPQECIEEKCPNEWKACVDDPKCQPAIQDCQKKCGDKESCWKLCLASKGDKAAVDVVLCGNKNHCLENIATPEDCIKEKCPN